MIKEVLNYLKYLTPLIIFIQHTFLILTHKIRIESIVIKKTDITIII